MSTLKSYAYPALGTWAQKNLHYSQSIRVGPLIICAGQGGWDPSITDPSSFATTSIIKPNLEDEINQAFSNVDYNLKHAGGKGWSQVYKVVTYSTDIRSQHELIVGNLRRWCPGHMPVFTEVGVRELGAEGMRFEIEVEAFDEEGAKEVEKEKVLV